MRTSVGWFSSPFCALIYQCSKYLALHSSKGYAMGAKFRQWLNAELHGKCLLLPSGSHLWPLFDYLYLNNLSIYPAHLKIKELREGYVDLILQKPGQKASRDRHCKFLQGYYCAMLRGYAGGYGQAATCSHSLYD
eukprot:6205910-Pleurochrysis_carterae.AAC.2